jgi:outer membrane protein
VPVEIGFWLMRVGSSCLAAVAALTFLAPQAGAADLKPAAATAREHDIVLEIGGGAVVRPAYEGASDYEVSPWPIVQLRYLWLPGFGVVKNDNPRREGFAFAPSFRYVSKRQSADYAALTGLNDVDAAFEVGGRLAYTFGFLRLHGNLRQGFGGHDGLVGEAGLDFLLYPDDRTEIGIGPRISYADADYMRTYLGVTAAESAASGLRAFNPGGGLKGVGAELAARYALTPAWAISGAFTWERLVGDAADSPIVQAGDVDQFTARLGLSYRFGLKLFN